MSLTAIFIPQIYNFLADFTLKQVGTYESIQNLDDKFILNTVSESSKDLWENFMDLFSGEEEEDSTDSEGEGESEGFFERNLYPTLTSVISYIYRGFVVIISFLGLITIIYLSYATSGVGDIERLKLEHRNVKERIARLETGIVSD